MTQALDEVAVLLVGTELLTGKVEEANLVHLARSCGRLGYEIGRVVMVHDDTDVIMHEVKALRAAYAYVVTSGGVGPTHDDVTVDAVAAACGRNVVVHAELEALLLQAGVAPYAAMRTARVPEGASLLRSADSPWPLVRCDNVFLFPGVPSAFARKLAVFETQLPARPSLHLVELYFQVDEGELVEALDETVAAYPEVRIGSYPVWHSPTYRTRLTFEHLEPAQALSASEALLMRLSVSQRAARVMAP